MSKHAYLLSFAILPCIFVTLYFFMHRDDIEFFIIYWFTQVTSLILIGSKIYSSLVLDCNGLYYNGS